ncbi:MAG: SDR family NAD(P)-dependent oxidoreductase [Polyangiaceae bacterium]|nr:SDR family NAD(P)-dependent oxidoreductase [Polyangiaceae bacterium]
MSDFQYSERTALITGASSGIGKRIALDFAARGSDLVLVARRRDKLEDVAQTCRDSGAQVTILVGDLTDVEFAQSVPALALKAADSIDFLVNNAGIPKHKQIYAVTPDDLENTLRLNFMTPAHLILQLLPAMLRQGSGYIINISSVAGRMPPPREAIYAASKYALSGLTEGLSLDLDGSNIHPAVVHVGPIDTEIWDIAAREETPKYSGTRFSPSIVSDAVFECIEKRRFEITVPKRMRLAIAFHRFLPGLVRRASAKWDPVGEEALKKARAQAQSAD